MSLPAISVIVTTHLRPLFLERALSSIIDQSFTDIQIVLCADESSPATKLVAAKYLRDQDIFLAVPQKKGPADTRNIGLDFATGKFVCFLDDDDSFESQFFETLVNADTFDADALNYLNYSEILEQRNQENIAAISKEKKSLLNTNAKEVLIANFIPNNSYVLRTDLAKKSRFDPFLQTHEDWDYLISLYGKMDFKHLNIDGPCVHLSNDAHRNNSGKLNGSIGIDFLSIYRKHPSIEPEVRQRRANQLAIFNINLPESFL
jgi:glycosyltransferase involved in cell wall biosynthesis